MTNLEIDQKLAENLGYNKFENDIYIRNGHEVAVLMIPDPDKEWKYFQPTMNMQDAWDIGKKMVCFVYQRLL